MPELWDADPAAPSPYSLPSDPKFERPEDKVEDAAAVAVEEEEVAEDDEPVALEESDEVEETDEDATPELILGKFKSTDDVIAAYQELEKHAGGLRNELGELRDMVDDRFTQLQNQPAQPQFDLDEMIAENPSHAADMAWKSGNTQALEYALDQWNAISPGARDLWIENKQIAHRLQQWEEQQQPIQAANEEQRRTAVVAQAYADMEAKHKDFGALRDEMRQVAAEIATRTGKSFVEQMLSEGTEESVTEALEHLYLKARDRKGDNLAEVSTRLAREHVQNTNRAVNEAIVASSTTTSDAAPQLSVADRISEDWAKAKAPYAQSEDGWNVS